MFFALVFKRPRWTMVAGLVLTLLGVLFAQGRAVWIGVFVGFFVFSFFMPVKRRLMVWGTMVVLALAIGVFSPSARGRAMSSFSSAAGSEADQLSKKLRFRIWNEAFKLIKSSPLTGVGEEIKINFKDVPGFQNRVWSETHNIYLQQAAERGVIGLGILLWVYVVILKSIWRKPDGWWTALVAILTAFLVAGLTESWINDSEVAMVFWSFVG